MIQKNVPMIHKLSSAMRQSQRLFSSTNDDSMFMTVAPSLSSSEGTTGAATPALTRLQGKVVAYGHVVSSFPGGLLSVRVDEDFVEALPVDIPLVIDPTNVLPKENKSTSSLGMCRPHPNERAHEKCEFLGTGLLDATNAHFITS
jgi:hypothetical protein